MSGITGVFNTHGEKAINRNLLLCMNRTLAHRGPNDDQIHIEPNIGLGLRQLSIVGLSNEQQPLFNENACVAVVSDGEIYNFEELTNELTDLGHQFRIHGDHAEVVVHAWKEWGEQCVTHFNGTFAFAIWDRHQKILFLARDRLGIKPLYYTWLNNGLFLFASELKALLVHPDLDRTLDHQAIEDYFAYGYVPEPKTIFKNTFKLNPGHTLMLRQGQSATSPCEYWDIPFQPHSALSEQEVAEELVIRLRTAVDKRLISEVPLGAFLSGGVDSSAIVALMSELMQEPINTCSISFADHAFDESDYAQMVVERYQTQHFTVQVEQNDFELIDHLAALYNEPFADSSAIPTYRACELAKKRVTVALSGDAGDENFAGYRRYRWYMIEERLRSKLPLGLRKSIFGLLGYVYPKADWAPKFLRAKTTFESLARDSVEGYFHSVSILDNKLRQQLFSQDFHRGLQGYQAIEVLRHYDNKNPAQDALSRVQYLDMKTYLAGDVLTKVDRAGMAHSLEVRAPLLDHEFVEWVSGLPASMKLRRQEGKYIFKKSLEPYLPREVLYRNKMGFAVPLASWFRGPLREHARTALLGNTLADTGIFNMAFIKKMLDQHQSGRRDYSAPIWTLLMFEAFLRNVLSTNASYAEQIEKVA